LENENPASKYERIGQIVSIFLKGSVWHANFQLNGKQRRKSLRTTSKKEAKRRALLLEAELIKGEYKGNAKPPSIESADDAYRSHLRTEKRAKKTLAKYFKVLDRVKDLARRRHVTTLVEIDLGFIDAYRKERTDAGAAPKTVYNETMIVRQFINFAKSRRLVATDPLAGLRLREPKPTPQPCWTPAEVDLILDSAKGPHVAGFTILAETGLRIGELKYLTWTDIDMDRNVLHVRAKDDWQPKTGDQRTVPMSERLRNLLSKLPRRSKWVLTAPRSAQYPAGDNQISDRRALEALKRTLAKLGLPGHLHTFRHAFISRALTSGIPEAVVRSWVGHVDPDVLRLYTHIVDADSQAAMRRLNGGADRTKE
jgi:integrase